MYFFLGEKNKITPKKNIVKISPRNILYREIER